MLQKTCNFWLLLECLQMVTQGQHLYVVTTSVCSAVATPSGRLHALQDPTGLHTHHCCMADLCRYWVLTLLL